jgi:hypothetical protein
MARMPARIETSSVGHASSKADSSGSAGAPSLRGSLHPALHPGASADSNSVLDLGLGIGADRFWLSLSWFKSRPGRFRSRKIREAQRSANPWETRGFFMRISESAARGGNHRESAKLSGDKKLCKPACKRAQADVQVGRVSRAAEASGHRRPNRTLGYACTRPS